MYCLLQAAKLKVVLRLEKSAYKEQNMQERVQILAEELASQHVQLLDYHFTQQQMQQLQKQEARKLKKQQQQDQQQPQQEQAQAQAQAQQQPPQQEQEREQPKEQTNNTENNDTVIVISGDTLEISPKEEASICVSPVGNAAM